MMNIFLHDNHLECHKRENFTKVQELQKDTVVPWSYMEMSNE